MSGTGSIHSAALRKLTITLALCLLAGAVGCGSASEPADPEPLPPPRGFWTLARDFVDTLRFDGRDRTFHVHLPRAYDHKTRLPLLIVYHGSGTSFRTMREWTGFDARADDNAFVVVYPGAYGYWRDGSDESESLSDIDFTRKLVEHLTDQWAVDPSRMAFTGFSAGGFLSFELACSQGLSPRAIAVVGATARPAARDLCRAAGSTRRIRVSALVMLGDEDVDIPLEGSENTVSLEEATSTWRDLDRCSGEAAVTVWPGQEADPHVSTAAYQSCADGTEVRSAVMVGLGHTWPRDHSNPSGIDATDIVTAFVTDRW